MTRRVGLIIPVRLWSHDYLFLGHLWAICHWHPTFMTDWWYIVWILIHLCWLPQLLCALCRYQNFLSILWESICHRGKIHIWNISILMDEPVNVNVPPSDVLPCSPWMLLKSIKWQENLWCFESLWHCRMAFVATNLLWLASVIVFYLVSGKLLRRQRQWQNHLQKLRRTLSLKVLTCHVSFSPSCSCCTYC